MSIPSNRDMPHIGRKKAVVTMKKFLLTLLGVLMVTTAHAADITAYDFSFTTLGKEEPLPLSQFRGRVMLIVNTASNCGFTKQYDGLQKLYDQYRDQGLVIIGVPSNDFGGQEPGTNAEIAEFCKVNYGVTFTMASKESVTGDTAHPFYSWAGKTLGFGTGPKWNFHKYLVARNGQLVDYFNSTTAPDSERLVDAVKAELAKAP